MTNKITNKMVSTTTNVKDIFKDNKLPRKLTRASNKNQIAYLYTGKIVGGDNSTKWYMSNDDSFDLPLDFESDGKQIVLLPSSVDPTSKYHNVLLMNAGGLSQQGLPQKVNLVAQVQNTNGGRGITYVDQEVFVDNHQIEVNGVIADRYFLVKSEFYVANERKIINPAYEQLTQFNAFLSSVSKKRGYNITALKSTTGAYEYMSTFLDADLVAFEKGNGERRNINIQKAATRIKLADSAGLRVDPFSNWSYLREETIPMLTYNQKAYEKDGTLVEESTDLSRFVFLDELGKERVIILSPGFMVFNQTETVLPAFGEGDNVAIKKSQVFLARDAVDGVSYMDRAFAESKGITSDSQFRMTPYGKGFLVLIDGLDNLLKADLVVFEGSAKADLSVYFKKSNISFSVFNKARKAKVKESRQVSRQVLSAMTNPEIVKGATSETKEILSRLYNLDSEILKEFVNLEVDEIVYEDDQNSADETDIDNLTAKMFMSNPSEFVKSSTNLKNLFNLLNSTTDNLVNGAKLYVSDASMRHMQVDFYSIIKFMKQGRLGVSKEIHGNVGISAEHAISTGRNSTGYFMDNRKAFLARFPFLHVWEGRLVNKEGKTFLDDETRAFYFNNMIKGKFQGLLIYSLWDMTPEGQSGADYDGDQTLFVTNSYFTNNFVEGPLFLDYSLVLNKESNEFDLVSGSPSFGGSVKYPIEKVFTKNQITYLNDNDITYSNGSLDYPSGMLEQLSFKEIVADGMVSLNRLTTIQNDIGRFTNIKSSIDSLVLELKTLIERTSLIPNYESNFPVMNVRNQLIEEVKGYNRLTFFLASAIRWEIDKAKHGGAYMERLEFLKLFTGEIEPTENNIKIMEHRYNVSLIRLFTADSK